MTDVVVGWVVGGRAERPTWLGDALLADRIATLSGCFLPEEVLPEFEAWFTDRTSAEATRAHHAPDATLLAVTMPPEVASEIHDDVVGWTLRPDAACPLPAEAELLGFEVVGLDDGLAHSWHCHDYVDGAAAALGVRPRPNGLLDRRIDARAVVDWMLGLPPEDAPEPVPWTVVGLHELRP